MLDGLKLLFGLFVGSALAQSYITNPNTPTWTGVEQGAQPLPYNTPGCTVGTTSTVCWAGSTNFRHIQFQNTSSAAAIACSWGGTPALNSATSIQLAAGQSALYGPTTGGVPSQALNCIASAAATPLYLEWH